MVEPKRRTNVCWTQDQRNMLTKEMALYVIQHKHNLNFPFKHVFIAAQNRLGFPERKLFRGYYTQAEAHAFRTAVDKSIADSIRIKPTIVQTPETSTKITPIEAVVVNVNRIDTQIVSQSVQTPQDDPMDILNGFMESAAKLTKLLISERQARQVLEIKLATQQKLIETNMHETNEIRRAMIELEDFLTSPRSKPTVIESKVVESDLLKVQTEPKSRKPRVHLVGMDTRNHAFFQKLFDNKLEFKFWTGDSRSSSDIKLKDTDHVFIAVDRCSHAIYDTFTNLMKRQGIKANIKPVNGGMTAMTEQLRELITKIT